jgi:isoquinoline 1-oxidoreductase alpha subunit
MKSPIASNQGVIRMVKLQINGEERELDVAEDTPLLWVIRDELGLTGTKFGCGMSLCGACTVHVDGVATRSCVTTVGDLAGSAVTTIEAVSGKAAQAVQAAWDKLDVVQCGYCQSGQVMSAVALLSENPRPSDQDIDDAMSGNVCRCATYVRIRAAIHEAADLMEA